MPRGMACGEPATGRQRAGECGADGVTGRQARLADSAPRCCGPVGLRAGDQARLRGSSIQTTREFVNGLQDCLDGGAGMMSIPDRPSALSQLDGACTGWSARFGQGPPGGRPASHSKPGRAVTSQALGLAFGPPVSARRHGRPLKAELRALATPTGTPARSQPRAGPQRLSSRRADGGLIAAPYGRGVGQPFGSCCKPKRRSSGTRRLDAARLL